MIAGTCSSEWDSLQIVAGVESSTLRPHQMLMPQDHEYEEVCKRCSVALFTPVPQDSGSDSDPSTDMD